MVYTGAVVHAGIAVCTGAVLHTTAVVYTSVGAHRDFEITRSACPAPASRTYSKTICLKFFVLFHALPSSRE